MDVPSDVEAELAAFEREINGTEWHARLTRFTASRGVCLRIEQRPRRVAHAELPGIEICRATLAPAVYSARKHIFPRP
jgi:hypothetical protein